MDIRKVKRALRNRILKLRAELDPGYKQQADTIIAETLRRQPAYQRAKVIMFYVDFKGEVSTRELIDEALSLGKKVCVPLTRPKTKELVVCRIDSLNDLVEGHYGVMEPVIGESEVLDPLEVDFVVNPGVAFDRKCNRLGYGGGYYDRFARRLSKDCLRYAIAYDLQIVDTIPLGYFDVPVDAVITEKAIYHRMG